MCDHKRMLNLQTERRLEYFFSLLGSPVTHITPQMEFVDSPFRLHLDARGDHLVIALTLLIPSNQRNSALMSLVTQCTPERVDGIPIRSFLTSSELVASCCLSQDSAPQNWLALYHTLKMMLWQAQLTPALT